MRALPPVGFEEERSQLLLLGTERARSQVAWGDSRLQRMDDVVDLDEILLRGLADIVRVRLHILETVEVEPRQIGSRLPFGDELGHGVGNAGSVGHPHRLGDEESVDLT